MESNGKKSLELPPVLNNNAENNVSDKVMIGKENIIRNMLKRTNVSTSELNLGLENNSNVPVRFRQGSYEINCTNSSGQENFN